MHLAVGAESNPCRTAAALHDIEISLQRPTQQHEHGRRGNLKSIEIDVLGWRHQESACTSVAETAAWFDSSNLLSGRMR